MASVEGCKTSLPKLPWNKNEDGQPAELSLEKLLRRNRPWKTYKMVQQGSRIRHHGCNYQWNSRCQEGENGKTWEAAHDALVWHWRHVKSVRQVALATHHAHLHEGPPGTANHEIHHAKNIRTIQSKQNWTANNANQISWRANTSWGDRARQKKKALQEFG